MQKKLKFYCDLSVPWGKFRFKAHTQPCRALIKIAASAFLNLDNCWIDTHETLKSGLVKIGQPCFCWYPMCVARLEGVHADLLSALRRCACSNTVQAKHVTN
jgi:hypothetical protein